MEEVVVGDHFQQVSLGLKDFAKGAVFLGNFGNKIDNGTGLLNPLGRCGTGACVEIHGIANDFAHFPTWIAVVADVGDAVFCQGLAADAEDGFANRFGYPAINAVADNIVEFAIFCGVVRAKIGLAEFDILQPQLIDFFLANFNLNLGKVEAEDFHIWITLGQGNEVTT